MQSQVKKMKTKPLRLWEQLKLLIEMNYMSEPAKALDKGIYGAAVDTVGGDILAKMISMISNQGVVSCCGNVGGECLLHLCSLSF